MLCVVCCGLGAGCCLLLVTLVVRWLLYAPRRYACVVCCMRIVVWCLLVAVCCLIVGVCCLLAVDMFLLFVMCCLLLVV